MKVKYNAPTSLTYAFLCVLVLLVTQYFYRDLVRIFFTAPTSLTFDISNPLFYVRLFTHIAGHADWNHLVGNMAYILLLGPMLEETYGSFTMLLMIIVTGFVTGVLNACFFVQPLLGASGVVFMMILLTSLANHGKDEIPLTFILIVALYLGREIISIVKDDNISHFAHIAGGFCGSLFGFFSPERTSSAKKSQPRKKTPVKRETARKNPLPPEKSAAPLRKKNEPG